MAGGSAEALPCTPGAPGFGRSPETQPEAGVGLRSTLVQNENADKQEAAAVSLVTVWKICSSRRQTESMADASARRDFQRDATAPMRRGRNPFHLVCCISAGRLTHITADAKRSLSRPVCAGSRQLWLIRKQSDFLTDSGSSSSYGRLIFYIFFFKRNSA